MGGYNGSPLACHFKRPYRSPAHILSTTYAAARNFQAFLAAAYVALKNCEDRTHELNRKIAHSRLLYVAQEPRMPKLLI